MFAASVKSTVAIGEVSVTIRKLSAKSLDKAAEATQAAAAATARAFGADMVRAVQDATRDIAPAAPVVLTVEQQKKARYGAYDRGSVIRAGVVEWTAPEKLPEALEDLDEEATQQLHEAIIDLSLPPIDPKVAEGKG